MAVVLLLFLSPIYALNLSLEFVSPTPPDAGMIKTPWVEINSTVKGDNITEIILNWNGTNYTVYDDFLVLTMTFDNKSEIRDNFNEAADISSYGNNGTLNGATWTASGKFGGAMQFDGMDDYITTPSLFTSPQQEMSLLAWFYAYNVTNNGIILMERDISTRGSIMMYVYAGRMYGAVNDNSSNVASKYVHINPNQWYFGAVTYKRGNVSVYLDASLVGTANNVRYDLNAQGSNFSIGRWPVENKHYFNGTIDNILIYNRSLSLEEIRIIYESNLYKFNSTHWIFHANFTNLTDGAYTYYIWAKNSAGNTSQSEMRTIIVESTNPQVKVNSVTLDSGSGRTLLIMNITSTDANLSYTNISVSNSTGSVLNSTITEINGDNLINLSVPFEGEYIITATACDLAGNINQSISIYNVDVPASGWYFLNILSKKPVLELGGFALTLGLVCLIAIVLIIALWRHNRKKWKRRKEATVHNWS